MRRRTWLGVASAATILLLAAGCTVRPVYMATKSGPGAHSDVDLSAVTVTEVSGRVAQQVRNNLLTAFSGGRATPAAKYVLGLEVETSEERLGFTKDETAPSYQVTVRVGFELKSVADDHIVLRSISLGSASYDRSNQNFANERARIDAENRAAEAVADEIRLRLALALAKEVPDQGPAVMPSRPNLPPGSTPSIISNNSM
ncbi:MAG: hypothetical protein J0H54_00350 [Rhizobiales bacterium]|nr:hypothetical protein [Hyphomicrobiales bacterium]